MKSQHQKKENSPMARMITYDQLHIDVLVRHDLSEEQRRDVLLFLREFEQKVSTVIRDEIPEELSKQMSVKVSR